MDFRARRTVKFSERMDAPWSIDRHKYGSDWDGLRRYLYCRSWSELVIRAELANAIAVRSEDETEAEYLKRLVASGQCLVGVTIMQQREKEIRMRWDRGSGDKIKAQSFILLSRGDIAESNKTKLKVARRTSDFIALANDAPLPPDADVGKWNVYCASSDVQMWRILGALDCFTCQPDCEHVKLMCDDTYMGTQVRQMNS